MRLEVTISRQRRSVSRRRRGSTKPSTVDKNGTCLVSDAVCNARGLTVGYPEWAEDLNHDFWNGFHVKRKPARS